MSRSLPRLIGITGRAGCGKDTVAARLRDHFGYHVYSLASPIKRVLNERFGWDEEWWADRQWKESPRAEYGGRGYVGSFGGNAFRPFSPREWAQWLGTEVGRELFGEDCWVDIMQSKWDYLRPTGVPGMVVPDVRFDNEARRIRSLGGVVIEVIRPGIQRINAHASENGVSRELVNGRVINDSSIEVLLHRAVYELESLAEGG